VCRYSGGIASDTARVGNGRRRDLRRYSRFTRVAAQRRRKEARSCQHSQLTPASDAQHRQNVVRPGRCCTRFEPLRTVPVQPCELRNLTGHRTSLRIRVRHIPRHRIREPGRRRSRSRRRGLSGLRLRLRHGEHSIAGPALLCIGRECCHCSRRCRCSCPCGCRRSGRLCVQAGIRLSLQRSHSSGRCRSSGHGSRHEQDLRRGRWQGAA
jgi:hypothetical protein